MTAEQPARDTKTVLVVEDDKDLQEHIRKKFAIHFPQTEFIYCSDLRKARQVLTAQKIDIVLTDMNYWGREDGEDRSLPAGILLIDWMRARGHDAPCLGMSSDTSDSMQTLCAARGVSLMDKMPRSLFVEDRLVIKLAPFLGQNLQAFVTVWGWGGERTTPTKKAYRTWTSAAGRACASHFPMALKCREASFLNIARLLDDGVPLAAIVADISPLTCPADHREILRDWISAAGAPEQFVITASCVAQNKPAKDFKPVAEEFRAIGVDILDKPSPKLFVAKLQQAFAANRVLTPPPREFPFHLGKP